MSTRDFMAMRREVMAEDRILARRRQDEARAKAQKVAVWLKEKYGVDRVYLFGSLAWGGFHSRSDIDLLVRGFSLMNTVNFATSMLNWDWSCQGAHTRTNISNKSGRKPGFIAIRVVN
ncbi:nucleotidyltransferase domain-containing protein [Moorella naiadis]|uniref:nucleotidyltransferase family protein n=1 Tax=Moorella naiadis (nom. illeg.) TaxID=3093670 RepID=UPI003D9CB668